MILRRTVWVMALWSGAALAAGGSPRQVPAWPGVLSAWDGDPHPDLRAVVVMQRGIIVGERYYNGETRAALHDVRSAGKSITSLLVGAAIDRGRIASVADPVATYRPEARISAFGDVAIADLLTMRSGLAAFDEDPASPGNEDTLDEAPDPIAFMFGVPREAPPGRAYRYNSLTANIAGRLVEKATGTDLERFAEAALFAPLGIRHWTWGRDVTGHPKGQGNLALSARDLAAIGEMVRGGGVFRGRRVLGAAWIEESLRARVPIAASDRYADGYGYFWYSKTHTVDGHPVQVSFASGNGGNKIYVVRELDLVVAVTSSAYGRGYGQRRSEDILKAVLAAAVPRDSR